jgi:hypothetical protein
MTTFFMGRQEIKTVKLKMWLLEREIARQLDLKTVGWSLQPGICRLIVNHKEIAVGPVDIA